MSIQAITSPPPSLLPAVNPDQRDSTQQQPQQQSSARNRGGSPITITRIDRQDYPDGYSVITTTYANKTSAERTEPKSAPPPLIGSTFDPTNGGQLSTLLSAQESSGGVTIASIAAYQR